jgi:hypothetical protein
MISKFKQHKVHTFPEAVFLQELIKKKTNIKPEIVKVQDSDSRFFLVIEQPRKLTTEEDIFKQIRS